MLQQEEKLTQIVARDNLEKVAVVVRSLLKKKTKKNRRLKQKQQQQQQLMMKNGFEEGRLLVQR